MVCGRSERARYKWTRPVQRARSPVIRDNFQLAAGYHRNRASAEERIHAPVCAYTRVQKRGYDIYDSEVPLFPYSASFATERYDGMMVQDFTPHV